MGQTLRPWDSVHMGIGFQVGILPVSVEELVVLGGRRYKEFEGIDRRKGRNM